MQCCPMDTYSGRYAPGDDLDEVIEIADCSCGDDCECMCKDCRCGRDDEDDETSFHYMPWGEIR